ncbi:hypothetical protein DPMN_023622 [Dreissena polymorpha]|uniref:Uncharacterized protein n=1 Tax=Dreissena polymorpha TaxID=45954 RepID=A0A9D4LMQ9_DREPO|nr:hypothetical protein DPMN_023622 [Dreissena polymorpha]
MQSYPFKCETIHFTKNEFQSGGLTSFTAISSQMCVALTIETRVLQVTHCQIKDNNCKKLEQNPLMHSG